MFDAGRIPCTSKACTRTNGVERALRAGMNKRSARALQRLATTCIRVNTHRVRTRFQRNLPLNVQIIRPAFLLGLLPLLSTAAGAQITDTVRITLPALEIQATRATETEAFAPRSVTVMERVQPLSEPGLSLERALRGLPGVWLRERGHYALGERLVIRGMGYRSAFGVRGVQVVLDGIPLTMADGQSVLDAADPVFVRRTEVLRGPASAYWGNGSGGVLFLDSAPQVAGTRVRLMGGSYGLRQVAAATGIHRGRHRLHVHGSRVSSGGYRAHSSGSFTRGGLQGLFSLGSRTTLRWVAAAAYLDTESPGALTDEQVRLDPRQADPRNVAAQAGKVSTHIQSGITLRSETALGEVTASAYGLVRMLENPLSYAFIDLDRRAGGAHLQVSKSWWSAGASLRTLEDSRLNHNNDGGQPGSQLRLDQRETVVNTGVFAAAHGRLLGNIRASGAIRADLVRFSMTDRHLGNGDQSGKRSFSAISPSLGIFYRGAYANFSTAFETPTTTELVNRPDGRGGFHPELRPQRTLGIEIGKRGLFSRLRYDAAIFQLHVRDRLRPEEVADGPTYYSNRGKSIHHGLELALDWPMDSVTRVRLVNTLNYFVFLDRPNRGDLVPGVPGLHLQASVRTRLRRLSGELAFSGASGTWADDDNNTRSDGFATLDLYLGFRARVQPFARIQNLLDASYNGSVVINAFGGRYFEPAQGRSVQAGAAITL